MTTVSRSRWQPLDTLPLSLAIGLTSLALGGLGLLCPFDSLARAELLGLCYLGLFYLACATAAQAARWFRRRTPPLDAPTSPDATPPVAE